MSARSYDPQTSHRDIESEVERLRVQVEAGWAKELRLLRQWGLRDGMSLLEVGAGPGFITEKLLLAFPQASITAVEVEPLLAAEARSRLDENGEKRVTIVTSTLLECGLPNDSFDFAFARLVFQHMPDPVGNAREIQRLLRPGGHVAIIDSDDGLWGLADPVIPEMAAVLDAYGKVQAACGGNRSICRRLLSILDDAGFVNLGLEAIVNHSDEIGLAALLPHLDPDRVAPLVACGALPEETYRSFGHSFRRFEAQAQPLLMMLLIAAHGRKPDRRSGRPQPRSGSE